MFGSLNLIFVLHLCQSFYLCSILFVWFGHYSVASSIFKKKNAAAHTDCIVVAHFLWNVCQMFLLVHSFAHNQPDLFALELEIVHRNTHARQLQCRQSTVCKHNHFRILGEWSNNQRSFVYRCCYFSGALGCCCKCFCHAYISQAMVQCAWIVRPYMNNNNAK